MEHVCTFVELNSALNMVAASRGDSMVTVRKVLVDFEVARLYHCISRCVLPFHWSFRS